MASIIAIIIIGFYIYAFIMAKASQRMPEIEISDLKNLQDDLQKETNGGNARFYPIPQHEIESCNAKLNLNLYINNDSISESKESLDNYINSVRSRVNERLVDKNCIDSLIIDVSSFYSKEAVDSLKSKHYRYSFPVK